MLTIFITFVSFCFNNSPVNKILPPINNIYKTNDLEKCDLYIPKTYTHCIKEYDNICKYNCPIYMINGCDFLASKNILYTVLKYKYNNNKLKKIVPETWIIDDINDMKLFKKEFKKENLYILKKNIQQKQGLYLSNNLNDIIKKQYNYKIIQKYINNTFLINNRKITLRIYLLIIYKNNKLYYYIHKNGKCLYTTKDYKSDINNYNDYKLFITSDPTTLNKNIYNINPITLFDLKNYLENNNYDYDLLYKNIYNNCKLLKNAFNEILFNKNKNSNTVCFQLFGLDYIFNNNLDVYLLEINKGPNMSPTLKKDYELKYNVLEDIFDKVKLIKKQKNNLFISI